jgi:CRISPR-associated protein Cas2
MKQQWYVVVSYDIVDDKRRSKVAKLVQRYGQRVQKSVFDCLLDEQRLLELRGKVSLLIDLAEDSVRYYQICASCRRNITIDGFGTVQEKEDVIII